MKISNLHIERRVDLSYIIVDVDAGYTSNNKLWFSVPTKYESWLSDDVYDAFLVAALYPAMYYKEPIEIKGCVSRKLYDNFTHYVLSIVTAYREYMNCVNIKVEGFAEAKKEGHYAATGFSAGVDSLCTFIDRYEKEEHDVLKISALFFFNVGSHGGGGEHARSVFHNRYEYLKSFPVRYGLPYVPVDSNLFDFYVDKWEYDAGSFCRAAAILLFQRHFSFWYLSSAHAYKEWMTCCIDKNVVDLTSVAEAYLNPLLSTEGMEIVTDGAQYTRMEKTQKVVDFELSKQYLNVCVNHWEGGGKD